MRKIKIVLIAVVLCLCLTASHAKATGCYYGGGGAGYWALPVLFFGIPAMVYALSGGYTRGSVYVQPSYTYYEFPSESYQRTYYRTRGVVIEKPAIPASTALQRTVGDPTYRYYCRSPRGYYPDVMNCPLGWKKVIPPYNPIDYTADK
ncbi:MAG: hypothetical protein HY881_12865 [Deltaproteobacteria bacterium]|nr:hypothetical protein [Deltaproteobacteria bacterium]